MTVHAPRIEVSRDVTPKPATYRRRSGPYVSGIKRTMDVLLIIATLPFVAPFILIISAAIYLVDRSSPFFLQERIGRNGKRFTMWKFRTMVPDAETLLEKHLEVDDDAKSEWESKQKLANDPRCTKIGKFLRSSSLDELPQLWNVFKGEMSLVGPRPMMPCQQALYPGQGYYRLRPGMTGSWQVSARNETSFAERAGYDDAYEQNLSFVNDTRIVVSTIGVVFRGTGI
ncbi:MAG: sugar transferase [Silicimonas sp.]|nr:sugar transferase [Silicimonas sp.]